MTNKSQKQFSSHEIENIREESKTLHRALKRNPASGWTPLNCRVVWDSPSPDSRLDALCLPRVHRLFFGYASETVSTPTLWTSHRTTNPRKPGLPLSRNPCGCWSSAFDGRRWTSGTPNLSLGSDWVYPGWGRDPLRCFASYAAEAALDATQMLTGWGRTSSLPERPLSNHLNLHQICRSGAKE